MEYIKKLLKIIEEYDFYPDIRTIDDIPYPELVIDGKEYLCLCSNNYLGLSIHPKVKEAAIEGIKRYGIGTCESRMVAGNLRILEDLERAIAEFKGAPAAMIFITGFMANIGIIPAIMDGYEAYGIAPMNNGDNLIIRDSLAHMSIVEGCKLSKSPTKTYLHNDMNHLEKILKRNRNKRKIIVTDGIFSMDGDFAPLPEIVELAQTYNAMVMIDDAHATGVIGENGRGTPEHFGVEGKVSIVMGTLSKALGATGGYLTGPLELIKTLRMKTNSYIFSSSIPPEQACGILAALRIIQEEPGLKRRLWKNVNHLKSGLQGMGFDTLNTETQIIPVLMGEEKNAIQAARMLFERGILTPAVRWPVVPIGRSRIRCTVTALHAESQINQVLEVFHEIGKQLGII